MDESKFIDGIHNYCDRWCERCYFTSRCRAFEPVDKSSSEENDFNNKRFWEKISSNLGDAMRMIYEYAEKEGIDLDAITKENEEEFEKKQKETRQKIKESDLEKLTRKYLDLGHEWVKDDEHFKEIKKDLLRKVQLGLEIGEETYNYIDTIDECMEVIRWYLFFINVKFKRALSGKFEDDGWEEENGFQKDSDGSAKIALISTQRTFDAWYKLFELLPHEEDNLIPILGLLQKILKKGEEEFPNAKNFIRPGFDEGEN